ncbi:MAG TPA: peptidoglycan-binding protein, partial [Nitrospiria bacterium]
AQNLSIECLEEIRMLSNLETEKEKLLQILLIGQPELREKLRLQDLRQLNQRIAIRHQIDPLDPDETRDYVACRLRVAGGRERVLFTPKALEKIHRHSGGIPRLVNILCDKALLAAYAQESRVVDDAAVARAASELEGLPVPASGGKSAWKKSRPLRGRGRFDEAAAGRSDPWFTPIGATFIGLLAALLAAVLWAVPDRFPVWFDGRGAASIAPAIVTEAVKPLPAPAIGPETAAAPEPQDRAGGFDDDGVFRVARPEETRKAALLTLLRVWGVTQSPAREEFADLDGDRLMADQGLGAHRVPADPARIQLFDYPCLVRGHWTRGTAMTDAVLVNLTDHEATVLDPLNGKTVYDLDVFQTLWGEEAVIYWKKLPGIELPLRSKGTDPSVKTVQKALRTQGLYLGKADGILGPNTKRAIRFFQQKHGLKDNSIFGPESYLVLSRVMFAEAPRLQEGDL